MAEKQLIVVSHTHWDREWYLPFQLFRVKLVDLMDRLLDLLHRDPRFRHFTLDGQTIILEDYLSVRPERADDIRQLVVDGRLLIGPWYVLPDEFLVSGESLIRNLMLGHRVAERFGSPMKVGYLPDPFGHIAEMPQILRGFGIDTAVVWRGVGEEVRHLEFMWRSPDGSEVLAEYLPEGYDSGWGLPEDPGALLEMLNHAREVLEPRALTPYLLLMNGDDHAFPQANLPDIIATANQRLPGARMVHGTLPGLFEAIKAAAAEHQVSFDVVEGEFRSSRYSHLLAGVLSTRMWIKQRNFAGENLLERWAEPFGVYSRMVDDHTGTSPDRPFLHLAWRHLLENQPHDSISGCSVDQVHDEMRLRFDWIEQLADTLVERYLSRLAAAVDSLSLPLPSGYRPGPDGGLAGGLVVFNSENGPRTDFVTVTLELPGAVDDVAVADRDGRLMPCQVLRERKVEEFSRTVPRSQLQGILRLAGFGREWSADRVRNLYRIINTMAGGKLPRMVVDEVSIKPGREANTVLVEALTTSAGDHNYDALAVAMREVSALVSRGDIEFFQLRALRRDEVEVGFVAHDVPAHGYSAYRIMPGLRRPTRAVARPDDTIENEFYTVRANEVDGTIAIIDKETGLVDAGLNLFVDGGDAGDEYTYSPPPRDELVVGPAGPVDIAIVEDGPARSVLRIAFDLDLPVSLGEDRASRGTETVLCPVTSEVCLYAGVRRIDITAAVGNLAEDHRLRVHFPTRIVADHAVAEGHFSVVARPVVVPGGGDAWLERPVGTYPQRRFVDVADGEVGLAVANRGLPEYEVFPGEGGLTIALTLLRCVGWLSRDDLLTRRGNAGPSIPTPGAQMLGRHVFHYSVLPHAGGWEAMAEQARWFASPLRAVPVELGRGALPLSKSFLSVEPEGLVVSAVKEAETAGDGVIVRVCNPTPTLARGRLAFFRAPVSAALVDLREQRLADAEVKDGAVSFEVAPAGVATVRVRFGGADDVEAGELA